jgi:hypothetical protein
MLKPKFTGNLRDYCGAYQAIAHASVNAFEGFHNLEDDDHDAEIDEDDYHQAVWHDDDTDDEASVEEDDR